MAHLLMIESWVGASGNLLPPLLRELGHSYTFVTRKASHYQNPMSSEKHAVFRYADDVIETETNDLQKLIKSVSHVRFDPAQNTNYKPELVSKLCVPTTTQSINETIDKTSVSPSRVSFID